MTIYHEMNTTIVLDVGIFYQETLCFFGKNYVLKICGIKEIKLTFDKNHAINTE